MKKKRLSGKERLKRMRIQMVAEEFGILVDWSDEKKVIRFQSAIREFDSLINFYAETGWDKDNPECASEEYLIKNGVCRRIRGKLVYVSRLVLDGEVDMK